MGGFNPISAVLAPVTTLAGLAQNASQAKRQYKLNERIIAEQEANRRATIVLENEEAARTRQQALKRTVARQRALYGAQGIDASDGSGEAVLLGLLSESEAEKAYRDRLDALRNQALAQDSHAKRQRNLLSMDAGHNARALRSGASLFDSII